MIVSKFKCTYITCKHTAYYLLPTTYYILPTTYYLPKVIWYTRFNHLKLILKNPHLIHYYSSRFMIKMIENKLSTNAKKEQDIIQRSTVVSNLLKKQ